MKLFQQIPLFRLFIPFVVGVILFAFVPQIPLINWHVVAALVATGLTLILIKPFYSNYKLRWLFGAFVAASLFVFGIWVTQQHTDNLSPNYYGNYISQKDSVIIRLLEPPEEKAKSIKIWGEIISVYHNDSILETNGKAVFYAQKSEKALQLAYGDIIIAKTTLNAISKPMNPAEFNYKRYLRFHNVLYQGYIQSIDWQKTKISTPYTLFKWANYYRVKLLHTFQEYGIIGDQYAVASALVLGHKGAISQELLHSYSSAGATHVLAVSGLHVGIIFFVLSFIFSFIDRIPKSGKWIKAVILILCLWIYALLTGLSPSVLRASTMFSFVILGKAMNRNSNIYNTLLASAFFLMLFNPYIIMEVGFQLSYLAVIGIVYLHPLIYERWQPNNWLLDKIWSLTAVSIAAQLTTFPLGILYFHQFPNYFFISNLFVIPIATLVLYFGILTLVTSGIPLLCVWIAKALNYTLIVMNFGVKQIEQLPYAITEGLNFNITETWLLYVIIVLVLMFIHFRKFNYFIACFVGIVALTGYQFWVDYQQNNQLRMIVYNVPKTTTIEFQYSNSAVLFSDSSFIKDEEKQLFYVKHNWWENGITTNHLNNLKKDTSFVKQSIYKTKELFQFQDKLIAINTPKYTEADFVLLQNNKSIQLDAFTNTSQLLILDSTFPHWRAKKLKTEFTNNGINCHAVSIDGAFILEL